MPTAVPDVNLIATKGNAKPRSQAHTLATSVNSGTDVHGMWIFTLFEAYLNLEFVWQPLLHINPEEHARLHYHLMLKCPLLDITIKGHKDLWMFSFQLWLLIASFIVNGIYRTTNDYIRLLFGLALPTDQPLLASPPWLHSLFPLQHLPHQWWWWLLAVRPAILVLIQPKPWLPCYAAAGRVREVPNSHPSRHSVQCPTGQWQWFE